METEHDVVADSINVATQHFEETGNVAAAWLAFWGAFANDRPVPETVYVEIERFASCIALMAEKAIISDPIKPLARFDPDEIANIWLGKFEGDPFRSLHKRYRDFKIFQAVLAHYERGMKVKDAIAAVINQPGFSNLDFESIKIIWQKYRKTHATAAISRRQKKRR